MGIEFDAVNKYIKITSPTKELTALEIYSSAMDWCDELANIQYYPPMKAVGKAPLGGGVYSDSIFILQDGWKIKPWSGDYQLIIRGTVITDDETARIVPPDSGIVEVIFQVSSQGTIIPDVAEWTQAEKDDIISDVDAIKPKTDNLPSDPASEITVQSVSEDIGVVQEELILHDSDVKGKPWNPEASLKEIKKAIEEMQVGGAEVKALKSIAQQLEKELSA